ncbi:uncharacterized protein LOC115627358 [Scaptodrosophila lebanonensis]|uniref:Glycosyltransferase family 92 protein n=1 Tax=Drosophila lebanonensis TaxID=7225 RepID=A0A6J2TVE5_DROLE|nr:uncharacterized protein LOC115627358 [Scaptodrosophila lebanonensis]
MAKKYLCRHKILGGIVSLKLCLLLFLHYRFNVLPIHKQQQSSAVIEEELLIDRRRAPTWKKRLQWIQEELPSYPLAEMLQMKPQHKKLACAPLTEEIEFHNDYWQVARAGNLTYYLFGAYYDRRETVPRAPLVRLLVMVNERGDEGATYPITHCQLWFKTRNKPLIVPVHEHKVVWHWGKKPRLYYPTLMACAVPVGEVPDMVSLVAQRCDRATNLLKVVYEPPTPEQQQQQQHHQDGGNRRPRFVVCVKTMDFLYNDMSWRLIEWLELMRLLGADKVVLYNGPMHANMTRVLRDYMENGSGFVELRSLSLGRGEPNVPPHLHHFLLARDYLNRILNEMIPYNDCLYRNMYRYDYIGVFDIDEVIMPLGNVTNWADLIQLAHHVPDYMNRTSPTCSQWVSFCFRNVYYPRYEGRAKYFHQLPAYFYMLQHVERTAQYCDRTLATKCLHSTRYAIGLHNHLPLHWTEEACCAPKSVPIQYAQMQHYREPDNKTWLLDPVLDDNIWRFQPQLQQNTLAKYKELGFLPSANENGS